MRLLSLSLCLSLSLALPEHPTITYEHLYQWGKNAYSEERWSDCVGFMRRAWEDFEYYQDTLLSCRRKCRDIVGAVELGTAGELREMLVFDNFVKRALCVRKCKREHFGDRPDKALSGEKFMEMEQKQPYAYMQLCYWKDGNLEDAVSSAYTYLIQNPNHKLTSENLEFYMREADFDQELMLVDKLEKSYQRFYMDGTEFYEKGDYIGGVARLHDSLTGFFNEIDNCRLLCESSFDYATLDGALELYTLVADTYKTVLHCKLGCEERLSVLKGNAIKDFLQSHFNYLQFAYYQMRNVGKAAQAVATYLLFEPDDEAMLYNKQFYKDNYNMDEGEFIPEKKVLLYYRRKVLEEKQLEFIEKQFKIEDDAFAPEHPDDYSVMETEIMQIERYLEFYDAKTKKKEPESSCPKEIKISKSDEKPKDVWQPAAQKLNKFETEKGIKVLQKEADLNGSYRFFVENIFSKEECDLLMNLQKFTEIGDGYDGQVSPHTDFEYFRGLSIGTISELAIENQVHLDTAKLVIDKSELARDFMQAYFNLSNLYFEYTHFVCREAKDDESLISRHRDDLSHPIHGDNCIINELGCVKQKPAYVWRDYSAIIYVNGDFEGGEFIFSDSEKNVQAQLKPSCGQMVGFTGDTLHGVKAVTKGVRCALATWMTLDARHAEKERIQAQQQLAELELLNNS